MPTSGRFGRQLRSWLFKASVEEEVDSELAFHLAMRERELQARGMTADQARRAAEEKMGDLERVSRELRTLATSRDRAVQRREWWGELRGDLVYAARQLRRAPAFTAIAVGTLALGIGGTTLVFSLLHAVVLRPLPFPEPERVVSMQEEATGEGYGNMSVPAFTTWNARGKALSHMAASVAWSFNLADADAPARVRGAKVTPEFFDVFGVPLALGRGFAAADGVVGAGRVVVLGYGFWQERFGGDRGVIGREVRLDGVPHTIIGVAARAMDLEKQGERLWLPLSFDQRALEHYDEHYLSVVGRLAPGYTTAQATAEGTAIAREIAQVAPLEYRDRALSVAPYADLVGGPFRGRLLILLGSVALVLLIACANVTSLLLARGASRARELAVRGALGAGRGRIVRQLLAESLLLALVGAALGTALAVVGLRAFIAIAPADVPRLGDAAVSGLALLVTFVLTLACTLAFGVLPALRLSRPDLQAVLRSGGRASGGAVRERVRATLVAAEVALAAVLLTGAGLLVRSALEIQRTDLHFNPERLLTARVTLPPDAYQQRARVEAFFDRVTSELRQSPGIADVSFTSQSPLGIGGTGNGLLDAEKPIDPANLVLARSRFVPGAHFKTMGIRLLEGRDFTDRDRRDTPLVLILSRRAAERLFPGKSAIGKRVGCCEGSEEDPKWKEVIGVVDNVATDSLLDGDDRPVFYVPIAQLPDVAWDWIQRTMTIVVRYRASEEVAIAALRTTVAGIDPGVAVFDIATMPERFRRAFAQARFNTTLLVTLGLIGLLLATVGIYGVIAWFVTQRTSEIGLRMALGASRGSVVALVTQQGLRPVLVGLLVGIPASLVSARLLASALHGVTPRDPLTLGAVVALFLVVAVAAAVVPARRAAGVAPTSAMGA